MCHKDGHSGSGLCNVIRCPATLDTNSACTVAAVVASLSNGIVTPHKTILGVWGW